MENSKALFIVLFFISVGFNLVLYNQNKELTNLKNIYMIQVNRLEKQLAEKIISHDHELGCPDFSLDKDDVEDIKEDMRGK